MLVDKITTNYCKVLLLMNENKILFNGKYLVPLTQVEISKMLNITTITTNSIFKELKNDELIESVNRKYFLTNKAIKLSEKLTEIKKIN